MKTITKFKKEIVFGLGTQNNNPEVTVNKPLLSWQEKVWVKYENCWYLTNLEPNDMNTVLDTLKNKCYTKTQLEEKILNFLS